MHFFLAFGLVLFCIKIFKQKFKVADREFDISWRARYTSFGATTTYPFGYLNLALLNLLNTLFDCLFAQKFVNSNVLFLTYSVDAVSALLFQSRIPVNVQQKHTIGTDQIQANATRCQWQQHYFQVRIWFIVELFNYFIASRKRYITFF